MKVIPEQLLAPADAPGTGVVAGAQGDPRFFRIAYVDAREAVLVDVGEARRLVELLTEWLAG